MAFFSPLSDSSYISVAAADSEQPAFRNAWGVDILISNGGFGLGAFYRREFNEEWFGFASLSISESKDDREVEQFDLYTNTSYVPGKLNRFLVIPLTFGIQHRLFKDDITDNFRPYVNAGAGPTMIYVTPFTDVVTTPAGVLEFRQIEFFKGLGRGQPHYTLGAFIGFGANFGTEKSNLFGVNFRYYFTYLFGSGLPSLYNLRTGAVTAPKKDFGGFFITLNVGMAY
ncbi:MAG: hypothetical protein AAB393_03625 [Bacteroidota bacterium]